MITNLHKIKAVDMSLRDHFASDALRAIVSNSDFLAVVATDETLGEHSSNRCATVAYRYADAMMRAREM